MLSATCFQLQATVDRQRAELETSRNEMVALQEFADGEGNWFFTPAIARAAMLVAASMP